jgi:ankyrin repeat protein
VKDEWSVRLLLKAGANPSRLSREGRSPMYIAAEKGNGSILRLLVQMCGVDVNAPATNEPHKGCPLHVAATFDNPNALYQLLALGADARQRDAFGRTPLDIARGSASRARYVSRHPTTSHCENAPMSSIVLLAC